MRKVKSWDEAFMNLAKSFAADKSKDPNTQVGCVIVDSDLNPVAFGVNGFGAGAPETEELWQRPTKYSRVIHAETNAIGRAAKRGVSTAGCTLYVTAFPCLPCAKLIIAAGINYVVADRLLAGGWDESCRDAAERFKENHIGFEIWNEETP